DTHVQHATALIFSLLLRHPPRPPLFPYTTLFRSCRRRASRSAPRRRGPAARPPRCRRTPRGRRRAKRATGPATDSRGSAWFRARSEEHTSELQSLAYLVCRLLLEKKKRSRVHAP